MDESILIFDTETATEGLPNPHVDRLKFFGCYSYLTKSYYITQSKADMQKLIDGHKIIVGFNIKEYDNIVLHREGIKLDYKLIVDLYDVFKKRAIIIKIKEGLLKDLLMSYSLDYITKILGIADEETGKKKIDFSILKKDSWTQEELKEIYSYLQRDIVLTKKLYEWVEDYFSVFKDFLKEEDVRKKVYLTSTVAKFTYLSLCKDLGWEPVFGEYSRDDEEERIGGGFVAYPSGEFYDAKNGPLIVKDVKSMYPHWFMMCNLASRKKGSDIRKTWNGGGAWKVEGHYYADELGEIAKWIKKLYQQRIEYKKMGDRREYTIKIILNSFFGTTDKEYYTLVYDKIAAGDCTSIGRQVIKYARKKFYDNGYIVVASDTDSIFLQDPFNDKARLDAIEKEIVDYIKSTVPFPQDTFGFGTDEYKYFYFFKGRGEKEEDEEMDFLDIINKPKQLLKKNYILVGTDGNLTIKNLGIRKKSNSPLSRKIFWEYLVPEIKKGQIKFDKVFLKNIITDLLSKDIMLMAMRKEVNRFEYYEKSQTSIYAQISKKYGSGIHFLIPNTRGLGVGSGVKLCSMEEFNQRGLKVSDIDLDSVWSELSYFVKENETRNIFQFG